MTNGRDKGASNALDMSALHYAEGWLSAGHGGRIAAAWNGARYTGIPWWRRLPMALAIAQSLKERGLDRGCDLPGRAP